MTVQMNPAAPQFLMLLAVLGTVALGSWIVVGALRHGPVVKPAACLVALVGLYGIALVTAGVTSSTTNLRQGDAKCFDEWCAALLSYQRDGSGASATIDVRLDNHGRRAQTSTLARAFVESGGRRIWPFNPGELQVLVPPGGSVDVRLVFGMPAHLDSPRFVVTEAVGGDLTPGVIVIGDESSPLHPMAGWPLSA